MAAKLVLSQLPVPYRWWRRLGVFRHGCLADDVERRDRWFWTHRDIYVRRAGAPPRTVVELGPGDSLATALFASSAGVERIWLLDTGRFAIEDPRHYRAALAHIEASGRTPPTVEQPESTEAILAASNGTYLTGGIASFASIGDSSVDLVLSTAVLEHVRCGEFDRMLHEIFRVLRPGGISSHRIDLTDHLGGALNSLRIHPKVWEHRLFARGGFYTNRLRLSEICRRAAASGFSVDVPTLDRWPAPPTPRSAMARPFRCFGEDDLAVAAFTLVLQKPPAAPLPEAHRTGRRNGG